VEEQSKHRKTSLLHGLLHRSNPAQQVILIWPWVI
jgi:hypothetical protein